MAYEIKVRGPVGAGASALKLRSHTGAQGYFDFTQANVDEVVSGAGAGETTNKDSIYDTVTGATVNHGVQISSTEHLTFSSNNVNVLVDETGMCRPANGTPSSARIKMRGPYGCRGTDVSVTRTTGETTSTWNRHVTGSLAKHCDDQIDSRITGGVAAEKIKIFTSQDHVTPNYVRNTGCWAADIDLSAISPWNSRESNPSRRGGILVSPRNMLCAKHYLIDTGYYVRFVSMNNVVCQRQVTHVANVGNSDWCVLGLDSPVDAGINFAKVLPDDYRAYLATLSDISLSSTAAARIATWFTNQYEQLRVFDWTQERNQIGDGIDTCYQAPIDATRLAYYSQPISGDSGSPSGVIINGQLVVLTCFLGSFGGPSYSNSARKALINAAMAAMPGAYQLTTVNISAFPAYP
jgi:hypothetical protein